MAEIEINNRYPIRLEVVTPLHIGAGGENDWVPGVDFVFKDGKIYVLGLTNLQQDGVSSDHLAAIFLHHNNEETLSLLGNTLKTSAIRIFEAPSAKTDNDIKTFIRNQLHDLPVVAGSSLKGAIRSALINRFTSNEDIHEMMRFLKCTDIELSSTRIYNSKIFNLYGEGNLYFGGWKHKKQSTDSNYRSNGFNTLYECVIPGDIGKGAIILSPDLFELTKSATDDCDYSLKLSLLTGGLTNLFKTINAYTRNYLEKELDFFKKYPANRTNEIEDSLQSLIESISDDGSSCLMKMSAGSGFHSITGSLRDSFDYPEVWDSGPNKGKKKFKSRKTVEQDKRLTLMGFVRLWDISKDDDNNENYDRLMDEAIQALNKKQLDEADKLCKQAAEIFPNRQVHNNLSISIKEERYRIKEEEARKAAEEKAEAEREQKERDKQFQIIESKAYTEANSHKWESAIDSASKALLMESGNQGLLDLISYCQQQMAATQKTLSERLHGKTSAGNVVGTTQSWITKDGNSFDDDATQSLLQAVLGLSEKEQKRFLSKCNNLNKLVDENRLMFLRAEIEKSLNNKS